MSSLTLEATPRAHHAHQLMHERAVVLAIFETLRVFVHLFPEPLFVHVESASYCGDLAFHVLQYGNVANGPVRSSAAALLYLLMRCVSRVPALLDALFTH